MPEFGDLHPHCADCGETIIRWNGDFGICSPCNEYKKVGDVEMKELE